MERLQKYMAQCGCGSRRKCEEWISAGLVKVNGQVVKELGTKVDPAKDTVEFRGKVVKAEQQIMTVMLHKPAGYVTTSHDQFGRPDVTQLVDIPGVRLYPVGRLDYQTTGLLLLTNDGDLAYQLTHPGNKVPKVYRALVRGEIKSEELHRMETGVVLDDGYKTAKAKARLVSRAGTNSRIEVTIYEGKNHQVRRMAKAVGHPVLRLERVAEGPLELGSLKEGEYRVLTASEVKMLKSFK
ncbi:MAG: rRNA pseudouridine synthase [Firmicutes bacterium]|nr:rRNA pseudouridine synthase [Bacillota bacterium]